MHIASVVGARPQFIKAAVVSRALEAEGIRESLVHTGQHYDHLLSEIFFRDLDLRPPDYNLGVGSGTHAVQTAEMLAGLENVLRDVRPDRVLVYGDTNSTLAGALAAAKLPLPVDHVEAGLRSFDRDMPEEINRVVTDELADLLFCPTRTAVDNLRAEGLIDGVCLVGDVMLDLALRTRDRAVQNSLPEGVSAGAYFVATIHRQANTDSPDRLSAIMQTLAEVSEQVAPVLLPAHPRLTARLDGKIPAGVCLRRIDPVGYVEMQGLILRARAVITDSGGVQKEALFHGVPCVTLRNTTEWPESVEAGMNVLLGDELGRVLDACRACDGKRDVPATTLDAFGGGQAARRIASAVKAAGPLRRRCRTRV